MKWRLAGLIHHTSSLAGLSPVATTRCHQMVKHRDIQRALDLVQGWVEGSLPRVSAVASGGPPIPWRDEPMLIIWSLVLMSFGGRGTGENHDGAALSLAHDNV